ncbi:MAG: HisA/HisF-related TIM barrel protein [Methylococcaceae bacterium]|nr:HisA/HisF-related TIM barrel protein [Methylococcaceae bacterium]
MQIIPVIDLLDGLVVAAKHGERDSYQPIKSKICSTSLIEDVLNGFLAIYPFNTVYIADLNSITNSGNNHFLIDNILSQYKDIEFWVDNGKEVQDLTENAATNYIPVTGSEYQNTEGTNNLHSALKNTILSLDFFPKQGYAGPKELLNNSTLWPQDIIIMSLEKVGKNAGPDIKRLEVFQQKHPDKNFIAAGGIRNEKDLLNLYKIGINHVLIASALHSGVINTKAIKKLTSIAP